MDRVIRAFLETLRKTQFGPPERMRDYQRSLLARLLRHTRDNVPFYRDTGRLAPLFRADDSIDWERWHEIPLLSRNDLQREFERLKSDVIPPNHGQTFSMSTSGSTGEPTKVVHTELSRRLGWISILLRDYERYGVDPRRRRAFLAPFTPDDFDLAEARRRDAWYPEFAELNLHGEQFDLADTRPVNELVDALVSLRPSYMRIQPVVLELMCAHDVSKRLADIGFSAIMVVGEYLSGKSKANAIAHLNCPILEHYGSGECGRMASSCPHCGKFHVHAETTFLEVIDKNGVSTLPGETGGVVVTPLYNYAMPLIRYDHNDDARVGIATGCPFALPTLDEIFGKKREPFMFPGQRIIRPTLSSKAVTELLGAQSYQIAQVGPERCEFRIIPGPLQPSEMRFEEMTKLLRSIWWDGLQVDYRIVDELPRPTPRAKFQMIRQEFFDPSEIPGS